MIEIRMVGGLNVMTIPASCPPGALTAHTRHHHIAHIQGYDHPDHQDHNHQYLDYHDHDHHNHHHYDKPGQLSTWCFNNPHMSTLMTFL